MDKIFTFEVTREEMKGKPIQECLMTIWPVIHKLQYNILFIWLQRPKL